MKSSARVHIEELRVSGFRAFENARLRFDDLTVLVGRNGAGKSTLIGALEFIRDALNDSLANALERRGGINVLLHQGARAAKDMSLAVRLHMPPHYLGQVWRQTGLGAHPDTLKFGTRVTYGFRIGPKRGGLGFEVKAEMMHCSNEQGFVRSARGGLHFNDIEMPAGARATSRDALALPLAAEHETLYRAVLDALKTSVRAYSLSPTAIRVEPPIGGASILNRDGSNAGDVLHQLQRDKGDIDWVSKHLGAITPGLVGVKAGAAAGRRLIRFHQRYNTSKKAETVFDVGDMSDGTLRCLAILLALRQKPTPALVCIEEIEDSVHPAALGVLLDAIEASTHHCQVLLTSHSPEALSHPAITPDQVRVIEWHEGRSQIFNLNPGAREMSLPPRSVGKLLRTNALFTEEESERVEGDFFAVS